MVVQCTSGGKGSSIGGSMSEIKVVRCWGVFWYFCLLRPKGKVSPVLEGLESSFWGQIGVELKFYIIQENVVKTMFSNENCMKL